MGRGKFHVKISACTDFTCSIQDIGSFLDYVKLAGIPCTKADGTEWEGIITEEAFIDIEDIMTKHNYLGDTHPYPFTINQTEMFDCLLPDQTSHPCKCTIKLPFLNNNEPTELVLAGTTPTWENCISIPNEGIITRTADSISIDNGDFSEIHKQGSPDNVVPLYGIGVVQGPGKEGESNGDSGNGGSSGGLAIAYIPLHSRFESWVQLGDYLFISLPIADKFLLRGSNPDAQVSGPDIRYLYSPTGVQAVGAVKGVPGGTGTGGVAGIGHPGSSTGVIEFRIDNSGDSSHYLNYYKKSFGGYSGGSPYLVKTLPGIVGQSYYSGGGGASYFAEGGTYPTKLGNTSHYGAGAAGLVSSPGPGMRWIYY